ncbi:Myb/SANT-like domain, harbinger transposase-derived nuclease domain protein [Tanacetum coccineum]|uniref:Myb/SANT-like domain, harbinger transposase-derived nuclease domain protein n=1 Tax=Tanacetum coccineum TaxID=301880 RepID=A0ABQ5FFJ2_9ASTR
MEGPKKRPLVALLAPMEGPKPVLALMEGPKQRKYWSDEMIKVLLDKYIEEMKSMGRNDTSLHKQPWPRLGRVFKEKFNIDFNKKDIKNGFDNLKQKYVGWLYLKNKSGNLYNPDTKMFNLTLEEWENFKQVQIHKRTASLQSKPLPYSDLCEIVFQSIFANGDGQWTNTEFGASASVSSALASGPSTSKASASGASASRASTSGASTIRERVGALNMDDDPLVDVAVHVDDDDGNSRAHKINDEVQPKKKEKTSRVTMDDLIVDMQSALRHIVGTTDGPTTEQCYEKLKLVGM